ncbi:Rossmann-fold NAD(P)-binding domain-containing protein [Lysobacter humi (ex Lee et al. 2017)]
MHVMIVGASGLVGQGALSASRIAPDVGRIVLLGRRRIAADDARIEQVTLPDLREADAAHPAFRTLDACLYCAGVVPGLSEMEFREVTFDLTLHVARAFAQVNPGGTFVYVSGAGADARSAIMPLRVKGQAENALRALPIRSVMLRPGIVQPVDGVRSPHAARAVGYRLAGPLLGLGRRIAPGVVITSTQVGRAMLAAARDRAVPGVLGNAEIERIARGRGG